MNPHVIAILAASPLLKYGLLFLFMMIEGPLITMFAGWLSAIGDLNILLALLVIIIGDVLSDMMYYGIGRIGKDACLKLITRYRPSMAQHMSSLEYHLRQHNRKSILIAKWTHVAGIPFLLTAGWSKIPFARFSLYTFLATLPKSLVFFLLGYYAWHLIERVNQYLEYGTLITCGILTILFALYLNAMHGIGKKFFDTKS